MKKMLRLIFKCFLVLMPVILVSLYSSQNLMKFSDDEVPYYIWNKEFCNTAHGEKYDVIILGDSTANASYIPEALSDGTVNLSLGGTSTVENYYTMQDWLAHNPAPKSVYISYIDPNFSSDGCFWTRTMFSHRYTMAQNWEMLQMAKKFGEPTIAGDNPLYDFLSYELFLPNKYITTLSNAGINNRYDNNLNQYNSVNLHLGRYISNKNYVSNASPLEFSEFPVKPMFDYYYRKLIELCLEHNIAVHLVRLPTSNISVQNEEWARQIADYYEDIQAQYPTVTVDIFESYDGFYFSDAWHMNAYGALKFSLELKERYPEEFETAYTSERIQAINDNINSDNRIEDLLDWTKVGPYTLVVYDGVGNFQNTFQSAYSDEQLLWNTASVSNDAGSNVYTVSHAGYDSSLENLESMDSILKVTLDGGATYDWMPYGYNGISFVVIDNYHKQIVCEKRFAYINNSYFVLQ